MLDAAGFDQAGYSRLVAVTDQVQVECRVVVKRRGRYVGQPSCGKFSEQDRFQLAAVHATRLPTAGLLATTYLPANDTPTANVIAHVDARVVNVAPAQRDVAPVVSRTSRSRGT